MVAIVYKVIQPDAKKLILNNTEQNYAEYELSYQRCDNSFGLFSRSISPVSIALTSLMTR